MNAALLMVNSDTYGSSGGHVPVFSTAPTAFEIALHEMGHSHFGLADEYPFPDGATKEGPGQHRPAEPTEPNVTATLEPLKWQAYVTAGISIPTTSNPDCSSYDSQPNPYAPQTVGAYEGAKYLRCGLYRPQYDCRMRTLGQPFCAICQQAIRRVFSPFMKRRAVGHR
ncbi:MAG TPA: M64 family metallopeptidase [Thermoanaerobaculia bacterium]|nr:M64 family metallopeptidase [Thermoanaerobaculia bacterium]